MRGVSHPVVTIYFHSILYLVTELERQALVNGGGSEPHHLERRYRYDVLDRLVGIKDAHWGEQDFRLNGNGQVTAERRNGRWRQAKLFGYDSEQNLCEVSELWPRRAYRCRYLRRYRQVSVAMTAQVVSSSAATCAMSMTPAAG
ncbi:hypothetical protein AU512_16495 [Lonsdalea iberica]|uniref:YD repeat-containing protein n=1 Tax=Lonsdalea iberica TaxID=1082703 RepID=A0ABX3XBT3_9GAMM|nr:hypothetical protein AU512_16495 [Lonsdalea iberica]